MTDHPITPPPELVKEWLAEPEYGSGWNGKCTLISVTDHRLRNVCAKAAQWGADKQLAEDAKWLDHNALNEPHLRITPVSELLKEAMRPKAKPPSLKEQALEALETLNQTWTMPKELHAVITIRHALEALPNEAGT